MATSNTETTVQTTFFPPKLLPLDSPLRRISTAPTNTCRVCDEHSKRDTQRTIPFDAHTIDPKKMDSRHRRRLSPGSQRLANPGRSSGSSFDDYDDSFYSRSPRDYVPSSRDPYYSSHRHSAIDPYTGRPRRSTVTKDRPIISGGATSPSRYDRGYEDYDKSIIPNKTAHKKTYSIDKDGSRLVDEREVLRGLRGEYIEPRERRYHLTGSYNRPREVDSDGYSYTDAAGMYRDTEPRYRRRRGSVEGGKEIRRTSLLGDVEYPPKSGPRDYPPTSKALDRFNDTLARRETAPLERDRGRRTSSRDRTGTYDSYLAPVNDFPGRPSRPLSTAGLPLTGEGRYGAPYEPSPVDDEDPRRSRQRFKDSQVESRGFGIRSQSIGKPSISPERKDILEDNPRPLASAYARDELIPLPNVRDFLPPSSLEDERRERERERKREEKERERDYERSYGQREKERDVEPPRDRERDARYGERDMDRDRDRDYGRRRDRDEYDRDYDKDRSHRNRERSNSDHLRHAASAAVAGAAGLGTAAYAARAGAEKREKDRDRDSDRDGDLPREAPRERERERERDRDRDRELLREPARDAPRESQRDRDRDRDFREPKRDLARDASREPPRDVPLSRESTREAYDAPREAPRDKDRERDRPRDRDRPRRREDDDFESSRRLNKREPNEREDASEREYSPTDRSSRRKAEDDGDEEYNRRLQQQQQELARLAITDDMPAQQSRHNSVLDNGLTSEPSPIDREMPTMSGGLPINDVAPLPEAPRDPRVRIVEPAKKEETPAPVKSILRKPTEKFPEHKDQVREGVAPLKEEAERKGIPSDARWTQIDRRLVNPEALDAAGERYEERLDCVIVLRVLTKAEIQKLADKTRAIREARDRHDKKSRKSRHDHDKNEDDLDESDDTDDDDEDDERDRRRKRDRERDSHRDRDGHRERRDNEKR